MNEQNLNQELESGVGPKLRELLRETAQKDSRSPSHQQWAWTRCRERMRETPRDCSWAVLFWKSSAFASVTLLAAIWLWPQAGGAENDGSTVIALVEGPSATAARALAAHSDPGQTGMVSPPAAEPVADRPNVDYVRPGMWASPFHAAEINADVIWVEGYSYIPASHTVR